MAKYNAKQRKEKLQNLINQIENKLDSYILDVQKLNDFHRFRSQMKDKYSLRNCALIESQFRGAIKVAGYNQWKAEGKQVQKGQKAINILAPSQWKMVTDQNGKEIIPMFKASDKQKELVEKGDLKVETRMSYRTVPVFDIHQTDAAIEDYPDYIQQFYLIGQSKKFDELYSAIEDYRQQEGVGRYQERPSHVLQSASNGFYVPSEHNVWVNPKLPKDHFIKTNIHELAHASLHKNSDLPGELKEYQAELTAGVVASYFGLEAIEPAINYIHSHIGDMEIKEKEDLVNDVLELSDKMIDSMERHLEKEFGLNRDMDKTVNDVIALEKADGILNEIPNSLVAQLTSRDTQTLVKEVKPTVKKNEESRRVNKKLDAYLGKQQRSNDQRVLEER